MAKFQIIPHPELAPLEDRLIRDQELASLFTCLEGGVRSLLAVSGGADSLALLVLAVRWRNLGANRDLSVATVDHGMRPEAAAEAAYVAEIAGRFGLPHRVLHWQGDGAASGVEARARTARYDLLAAHARAIGATRLVTAHHLGDQAETVLMRLAAGSGPAGLAAMRPSRRLGDVVHLRPLLGVARERLVGELRAHGIGWCEDAMNSDARFARARLRASRHVLEREGLSEARLGRLAARTARMEDAVEGWADAHWRGHMQAARDAVFLDAAAMAGLPAEIAIRLIGRMIAELGGQAPRLERLEAAAETLLAALDQARPAVRTLGGIRLEARAGRLSAAPAPARRRKPPSGNQV